MSQIRVILEAYTNITHIIAIEINSTATMIRRLNNEYDIMRRHSRPNAIRTSQSKDIRWCWVAISKASVG